MTEHRGAPTGMDPTEIWRQWYETGVKMWSDVARGDRENYLDPHGIYRQWFEGMRQMRERLSDPATRSGTNLSGPDMQELWDRWAKATMDSWRQGSEMGHNAKEILPRWMRMLEEAQNNLLSAGAPPSDPLQFATQWYNATSGPFSDFVGDVIEREEFLEPSSRFLQHYASFYKVYKRNSEEYLKNLQIPVRSDITRIATLVVNLEDKVDHIEELLEDFEYGRAEPAAPESVQALEQRLDRVEDKLDRLLAMLENGAGNSGARSDSPPAPRTAEVNGSTAEIKASDAARRKAREMGVDLATVDGTGANGLITVDDVRKKGES